ncbi:MAG: aminoacyl-histidine dipeptidase [Mucinivorans sp.]
MKINELQPVALWSRFAEICAIPHPSKHEAALINYLKEFAIEHDLSYKIDETGNIMIAKAATAGKEKSPKVTLQAHVDMVPQKNSDIKFNFTTDPIEAYVDGSWVKARNTTLGADNGIGCAAMLAILSDRTAVHPAIEALFTIDEETGLTGANGLGKDMLSGSILINLDSEDEGELYIGCAGAVNNIATMNYKKEASPDDMQGYILDLRGLKGGHSGAEIILQRANANKIMVRFLRERIAANEIRISTINGGSLRNAIPREARALVAVPRALCQAFEAEVKDFEARIISEFSVVEDDIKFSATKCDRPSIVINGADQTRIIAALTAAPNGIMRMSDSVPALVETSTNLSQVIVEDGKMQVIFMTRCMVNYGKRELSAMIRAVFELAGAKVVEENNYDGWAPDTNSKILTTMKVGYEKLFGSAPAVKAIHAGLECGIIGAKYPGLDMISIGPTMRFPHSPDEKVNIETVDRFYKFLLYTLSQL